MSARCHFKIPNGPLINLRHPTPADYADFFWQAEHLAKEARYNGATPEVVYSVAEHAARGADAAYEQTRDPLVAAAVLIHDNPESLLRDETTPKKNALAEEIAETCGVLAPQVLECYAALERRHEAAVHMAAGVGWPLPEHIRRIVKQIDRRLLVTEWRDLMGGIPHPDREAYADVQPLPSLIVPRHWRAARLMYLDRARAYLPVLADRRGENLHDLFPQLRALDGKGGAA